MKSKCTLYFLFLCISFCRCVVNICDRPEPIADIEYLNTYNTTEFYNDPLINHSVYDESSMPPISSIAKVQRLKEGVWLRLSLPMLNTENPNGKRIWVPFLIDTGSPSICIGDYTLGILGKAWDYEINGREDMQVSRCTGNHTDINQLGNFFWSYNRATLFVDYIRDIISINMNDGLWNMRNNSLVPTLNWPPPYVNDVNFTELKLRIHSLAATKLEIEEELRGYPYNTSEILLEAEILKHDEIIANLSTRREKLEQDYQNELLDLKGLCQGDCPETLFYEDVPMLNNREYNTSALLKSKVMGTMICIQRIVFAIPYQTDINEHPIIARFLLDTGSPHTYLSKTTWEILQSLTAKSEFPKSAFYNITIAGRNVSTRQYYNKSVGVNILGSDAYDKGILSIAYTASRTQYSFLTPDPQYAANWPPEFLKTYWGEYNWSIAQSYYSMLKEVGYLKSLTVSNRLNRLKQRLNTEKVLMEEIESYIAKIEELHQETGKKPLLITQKKLNK
eukprot:TRINITY_DN138019_c0_g1_i1.p1 TRINITY_DN138019_c0_g1~~TRINITY_DN138019_c0_g1_i1.p1  ORF type:complete len:506 (-),score=1.61 TRINITY_DN138019_c0_g1_i1:842-2359(-)